MLWSRKVRQLTILFRDLARSKLWDGRRVDSVTGQSAPGVHSHNANSCPSKTFIHGRRNSNVSTWIKLSARFKTFLKPWQIVYVDTSGKWRSKSSRLNHYHTVFVCARSGFKLTFPHKKRSHFPLVYMKFVARIGSHPQHLISDKACEINTKVRFIAAGKRLSTHLSSKKQASQFRCTWKGYRRPGQEY